MDILRTPPCPVLAPCSVPSSSHRRQTHVLFRPPRRNLPLDSKRIANIQASSRTKAHHCYHTMYYVRSTFFPIGLESRLWDSHHCSPPRFGKASHIYQNRKMAVSKLPSPNPFSIIFLPFTDVPLPIVEGEGEEEQRRKECLCSFFLMMLLFRLPLPTR